MSKENKRKTKKLGLLWSRTVEKEISATAVGQSLCHAKGPGKVRFLGSICHVCPSPSVSSSVFACARPVGGRTVERWDRRHKIINRETRLWRSRTARWKIRETRVFLEVSRLKVTASSCVRSMVPVVPGRLAYGHGPLRGSGCTETEQKTINRETRQPGCRTG